uniref:Uncharacterized protein n=2 Tax=Knipowitschia caucasica TaxID=637954 RepID=A0AAV2LG18_KNICA
MASIHLPGTLKTSISARVIGSPPCCPGVGLSTGGCVTNHISKKRITYLYPHRQGHPTSMCSQKMGTQGETPTTPSISSSTALHGLYERPVQGMSRVKHLRVTAHLRDMSQSGKQGLTMMCEASCGWVLGSTVWWD